LTRKASRQHCEWTKVSQVKIQHISFYQDFIGKVGLVNLGSLGASFRCQDALAANLLQSQTKASDTAKELKKVKSYEESVRRDTKEVQDMLHILSIQSCRGARCTNKRPSSSLWRRALTLRKRIFPNVASLENDEGVVDPWDGPIATTGTPSDGVIIIELQRSMSTSLRSTNGC
jgi:hypothetical protein